MVRSTEEAGIDVITDLVNQIILERFIPSGWELSSVVNCFNINMHYCYALKRGTIDD